MTQVHRRSPFYGVSRVALTACLTVGLFAKSPISGVIESSVRSDSHVRPLELILLPEEESWLILAGAPVVAKLKETGQTPALLALSAEPTRGQQRLLNQLFPYAIRAR